MAQLSSLLMETIRLILFMFWKHWFRSWFKAAQHLQQEVHGFVFRHRGSSSTKRPGANNAAPGQAFYAQTFFLILDALYVFKAELFRLCSSAAPAAYSSLWMSVDFMLLNRSYILFSSSTV